ncbi:MAG: ABC transporter substrate-binding protein [Proteobacteria bacterium]|nr:ABC transporter substrate-binding protein [Pseudomonadota bacterium]
MQLLTATGTKVVRQHIFPICLNASKIERYLHKHFTKYRQQGEWLKIDFQTAIDEAKKQKFQTEEPSKALSFEFETNQLRGWYLHNKCEARTIQWVGLKIAEIIKSSSTTLPRFFMFTHIKILFILLLSVQSVLAQDVTSDSKVLFINSYHKGYAWSDGIQRGVEAVLAEEKSILLKTIEMDTKRNTSTEFILEAALKVKQYIEKFKPDVVIAADDNASKYVVEPYYKNVDLPFVFCGVNWDANVYGYPYSNTTGMVEVSLIESAIRQLKNYAKGSRIGFIGGDVLTLNKELKYQIKLLGFNYDKIYLVKTFKEWQEKYLQLQQEVDMIIFYNYAGISGWKSEQVQDFILKNTKIPTGSVYRFISPLVAITIAKNSEEQGRWSAQTALKILAGVKPSEIPIVQNKEGKLIINMKLVNELGLRIPLKILRIAEIIK